MPTLANIRGASLAPDFSQALGILFSQKQTRDRLELEETKQGAIQEQIGALIGGAEIPQLPTQPGQGGPDPIQFTPAATGKAREKALLRLISLDPAIGRSVSSLLQSGDVRATDELRAQAVKGLRQASFVSKQTDFASKQRALTSLGEQAIANGEPLDRIIKLQNLSEPELDLELQRMKIMGQDLKTLAGPAGGDFSKAPGVITRDEAGNVSFEIPVLDKATGEFENKVIRISGEVVSRLGETGTEQSLRLAGQTGEAEVQKLAAQLETKPKITAAEKQAAAQVTRTQGIINRGLTAADSVPILARSLELLESVKTGGFDAFALRAKQIFGVEGADEAELSANLGKSVLSQLRTIFGAAFTEGEGKQLVKIEAAFGKSVAGNIRLIRQTKKIAERAANRAIKAAERSGDTDTADEIREALAFSLTPKTQVLKFDASGNLIQ